jgi:hypothetical protein
MFENDRAGFASDSYHPDSLDNHIFKTAKDEGQLVPRVDFNYDAIDGPKAEKLFSMAEIAAGFSQILDWVENSGDLASAGGKIHALRTYLDPVQAKFRSLAEIERAAGVSRAAVSDWLLELRDFYNLKANFRGPFVRQHCREGQLSALAAGRHSSNRTRKQRDATITKGDEIEMTRQEVASAFPTLDRALDEVQRLQNELEQTHKSIFKAATAAPAPKPAPAPTPKPSPRPSSVPKPPSRLEELTIPELKAALDIANHAGATEVVKDLYAHLNRRRAELKVR